MSRDTADRLVQVYGRFGNVPQLAEVSRSVLYLLAAPSTPAEVREDGCWKPCRRRGPGTGRSVTGGRSPTVVTVNQVPRPGHLIADPRKRFSELYGAKAPAPQQGSDRDLAGAGLSRICEKGGRGKTVEILNGIDRSQSKIENFSDLNVPRNERRNITKGQKAMAYAFIYPDPEKGGRGNKTVRSSNSFTKSTLSDAPTATRTRGVETGNKSCPWAGEVGEAAMWPILLSLPRR